jgi:beta-glucosidase
VQWSFGHGLSYTQFTYSDLRLNTEILKHHWDNDHESELEVTVTVTNSGRMAGAEIVFFFTFDEFRSATPENKRLRGYQKVWLDPGQSMEAMTKIALDDLRFVGPHDDTHYILEDGMVFRVGVGSDVDCRSDPGNELCSNTITIQTENDYVGACEAACQIWERSGCDTFTADSCRDACSSIHNQDSSQTGVQLNNDGWGWTYVQCLESLVWNEAFDSATDCWKSTKFCRDVVNTSGMDEFGSGKSTRSFSPTGITNAATAMSLFAGLFASVMIMLAMRGQFSQESEGSDGLQFSPVSTSEFA